MADELIDILNDDLTVSKTCLKSDAHKHGYLHASIHVWFYTDSGEILIQKRSSTKIAFPNLWDVSVAGHISTGENEITAALREVEEEIGLVISKDAILKIGSYHETHQHRPDFIDNEIHLIYISKLYTPINELKIQKEELSAIKLISIDIFKKELENPNFSKTYVPHSEKYYKFVLQNILKQIN